MKTQTRDKTVRLANSMPSTTTKAHHRAREKMLAMGHRLTEEVGTPCRRKGRMEEVMAMEGPGIILGMRTIVFESALYVLCLAKGSDCESVC